ncbi:MAG: hypothetical protein EXQ69_05255 [Acidimicrobiia bacterium]|nr:hypothetical protein [Acidimicrobiia bacterium]
MNDPTNPNTTSCPFGDDTDEAISAWLDGELDAFAADHGCSGDEARARLEASPEAVARRERFGAVQQVVGESVELAELDSRRLVRTALASAPTAQRRPWRGLAITAVAAAAALVVGVGVISSLGTDDSQTATTADAKPSPAQGDLGYIGDVTDPENLRSLLDGGPGQKGLAPAQTATPESEEISRDIGSNEATSSDGAADASLDCAGQFAASGKEVFRATGNYEGRAAVLIGIERSGRTIVLVVAASDCQTVLTSISR